MKKIIDRVELLKATPSDINEHLQTLIDYSKKCNHVTEFGVRFGVSTWALMLNPKKLISYDIKHRQPVEELKQVAAEYGINYTFIEADVLKISIEETDMLFIDTLHRYDQLIDELKLHASKVCKYILMHDTDHFGVVDQGIYDDAGNVIEVRESIKRGLKAAYMEFLETPEGCNWVLWEDYPNNNGLTVLRRKSIPRNS